MPKKSCSHRYTVESLRPSNNTTGGWMLLRYCAEEDCKEFVSSSYHEREPELRHRVDERQEKADGR
jgi:hypothetical protein